MLRRRRVAIVVGERVVREEVCEGRKIALVVRIRAVRLRYSVADRSSRRMRQLWETARRGEGWRAFAKRAASILPVRFGCHGVDKHVRTPVLGGRALMLRGILGGAQAVDKDVRADALRR